MVARSIHAPTGTWPRTATPTASSPLVVSKEMPPSEAVHRRRVTAIRCRSWTDRRPFGKRRRSSPAMASIVRVLHKQAGILQVPGLRKRWRALREKGSRHGSQTVPRFHPQRRPTPDPRRSSACTTPPTPPQHRADPDAGRPRRNRHPSAPRRPRRNGSTERIGKRALCGYDTATYRLNTSWPIEIARGSENGATR